MIRKKYEAEPLTLSTIFVSFVNIFFPTFAWILIEIKSKSTNKKRSLMGLYNPLSYPCYTTIPNLVGFGVSNIKVIIFQVREINLLKSHVY